MRALATSGAGSSSFPVSGKKVIPLSPCLTRGNAERESFTVDVRAVELNEEKKGFESSREINRKSKLCKWFGRPGESGL
jgi:hypothetical protein